MNIKEYKIKEITFKQERELYSAYKASYNQTGYDLNKNKLGKFKGAMLSLMPMGVYDTIDMIDTAVRTGLPIKTGTGNKTIRGIGKAMRGYGKAMTGRKK